MAAARSAGGGLDEREPSATFLEIAEADVEGEIEVPSGPPADRAVDTLDEPVHQTILRDLRVIGSKFLHVLVPKNSTALLREWDLWGPLILCIFLALMLQDIGGNSGDDGQQAGGSGPQFAEVFVVYWVGAAIVTLNIKLLGGSLSFFQAVCVLGYCVSPLALSLLVCRLVLMLASEQTLVLFSVRFVVVVFGFAWSTFASTAFLSGSQPPRRKALAVYPIFLFYFVISWLIISHT